MIKTAKVKNLIKLAFLGVTTGLVGCSFSNNGNIAQAQPSPKIVASHNIICDLVETIAEDTVDLTCLIDPNQDVHTYRPTPSQRKELAEAKLILYGGYQLEPQIIKLIEATEDPENPQYKLAVYEEVVTKPILAQHEHTEDSELEAHSEGEDNHHGHSEEAHAEGEDNHHGHSEESSSEGNPAKSNQEDLEPDPHVWHNIENTVAMIELIQSILLQINPQEAELYLKNRANYTEQLWQLDNWIKEQITTIPEGKRVLVTTHDSLNYYVQAYNLEDYQTLQGLSLESSPTASQVKKLAQEIKQTGVPTIFAESTSSDRVMRNVARAADVQLSETRLFADGLGEASNYTEMMIHNTCAIVDGLEGKCTPFKL